MSNDSLPPDYQEFKASIHDDAHDDWLGIHEVWYSANSRYPSAALSERLAIAERIVVDLLSEGRLRLYRGGSSGPSQQDIVGAEATALLRDWATWVPSDDVMYWLGAVDDVTDAPKREFGRLKGRVRMVSGFHDLDAEIERDFEESIDRPIEP